MVETQQAPRMVNKIMTCMTDVLTDHVYHNRPQVRRRRVIWSMMGRLFVRATLHPDAPAALELSIARTRVLDYL